MTDRKWRVEFLKSESITHLLSLLYFLLVFFRAPRKRRLAALSGIRINVHQTGKLFRLSLWTKSCDNRAHLCSSLVSSYSSELLFDTNQTRLNWTELTWRIELDMSNEFPFGLFHHSLRQEVDGQKGGAWSHRSHNRFAWRVHVSSIQSPESEQQLRLPLVSFEYELKLTNERGRERNTGGWSWYSSSISKRF